MAQEQPGLGEVVATVVVGIGIVAAVWAVVPQYRSSVSRTTDLTRAKVISGLNGTIDRFRLDVGRYPAGLEDLLMRPAGETGKGWSGPYLKAEGDTNDGWDRPLRYRYPGAFNEGAYDLWSAGKDAVDGSSDDICNWTRSATRDSQPSRPRITPP